MKLLFTIFTTLTLLNSVAYGQLPKVSSGKVVRVENFQSKYIAPRNVDIWLPQDYSSKKKYAVLYMHDGQMLFDSTITWNHQEWEVDETMSALLKEGKIRNCIVVGIWNTGKGRHSDYFPQKPFESLSPMLQDSLLSKVQRNGESSLFDGKVRSDSYLKFIVKELKPYIDSHYSTLTNRKNTFIAGSSMGGLISMYALCEYPRVFGGAACLSTHWVGTFTTLNNPIPDAFLAYLKKHLPSPKTHKIYFDYGTKTLDSLYEPYQLEADKIIAKKGYSQANWITRKFVGDNHSERSWSHRLAIPLEFLLGQE